MSLVVFGASGATGRHVVQLAGKGWMDSAGLRSIRGAARLGADQPATRAPGCFGSPA